MYDQQQHQMDQGRGDKNDSKTSSFYRDQQKMQESLEEALKRAKERRQEFEKTNEEYIEQRLSRVIQPMVINLLNQMPADSKQGMKSWLLTQFNTQYNNDPDYAKDYNVDNLKSFQDSEQYKNRSAILRQKVRKGRIEELREEIRELEALKNEVKNADGDISMGTQQRIKTQKSSRHPQELEKSQLDVSKRPSGEPSKLSGSVMEATVEFQLENIFDKYSHHESNIQVLSEANRASQREGEQARQHTEPAKKEVEVTIDDKSLNDLKAQLTSNIDQQVTTGQSRQQKPIALCTEEQRANQLQSDLKDEVQQDIITSQLKEVSVNNGLYTKMESGRNLRSPVLHSPNLALSSLNSSQHRQVYQGGILRSSGGHEAVNISQEKIVKEQMSNADLPLNENIEDENGENANQNYPMYNVDSSPEGEPSQKAPVAYQEQPDVIGENADEDATNMTEME